MRKNGPAARRRNTASVAFLPQFPLARNRVPAECAPMILFSVGLPGRFAAWCDAAVARLAGEAAIIGAETPDEVAAALIRSAEPNLVVTARCPTPALRTLLDRRGGADFCRGRRSSAKSLPHGCGRTRFPRGYPREPNSGVAAPFAPPCRKRACSGRVDPGHFSAGHASLYAPPDIGSWWEALDPAIRTVADGALRASGEITWDRSLLLARRRPRPACRKRDRDRRARTSSPGRKSACRRAIGPPRSRSPFRAKRSAPGSPSKSAAPSRSPRPGHPRCARSLCGDPGLPGRPGGADHLVLDREHRVRAGRPARPR